MTAIKTWQERCEEHPDHEGSVTEQMIQQRMQEEIDELRKDVDHFFRLSGRYLQRANKAEDELVRLRQQLIEYHAKGIGVDNRTDSQ